jgi:hypothetical protein
MACRMSSVIDRLERDLREIFGSRLQSLVVYGARARLVNETHDGSTAGRGKRQPSTAPPVHVLAIVDALSRDDLRACARRVSAWHAAGAATPLVLATHEFDRSLDVFPIEFGAILADHSVIAGANPFERLTVDPGDLRRAIEVQARSHLLHLREGYIETQGRGDALAVLVLRSAPAFATLITSIARLEARTSNDAAVAARQTGQLLGLDNSIIEQVVGFVGVQKIPSADADALFPAYLEAAQRLVDYVDRWSAS